MDNINRPYKNTLSLKWDILFEETPKEWIGFKPTLGDTVYSCYACRHMFSCLTSFQDHVNRRITVLKYNCSGCSNEVLTFYNRCSFLLHTRKHYGLNEGKINLAEVSIHILPVSLAGFLPHPNIPVIYATEESTIPENVYINTQFYNPDSSEKGKQVITLKPNDIIFKQPQKSLALRQICPNVPKCEFVTVEYQEMLRRQNLFTEENNNNNNNNSTDVEIKQEPPDIPQVITMPVISKVETVREMFKLPKCLDCNNFQKGTMAEHYLGQNKPCDDSLRCIICKFVASTACSLKAHTRIHENIPPFVCPDCGKDFPSSILLRKHMDDVCFHLAKHVKFRCPGKRCGKLFASSSTFAQHFHTHLKSFYMCSVCSVIVLKPEEGDVHKVMHDGLCTMEKMYECPLCPEDDPIEEENSMAHVNIHTTDIKGCMYAYMCKHCRSYFRSTATYATHLLKCSAKHSLQVKKLDIPRYITRECQKCPKKIIFNQQKPATLCTKCKQEESKPVVKRYFCILCNKQILPHQKSFHIRQCRYGKPYVYLHRLSAEDLENKSFSSSSSDLDSSSSPWKLRRHRSSDSSRTDDSAKKKRKRTYNPSSNKHRKVEKEIELDLTAEKPIEFDGTYRCKLCEYSNANRDEFHAHIKEHRDISTAYQCMECGECFVVKPSLIKHLLHFHNICDYDVYLEQNDCFDVDAVKELETIMRLAPGESKEPVAENQCRVCRQQFEDALSLNKHFRIHGMAFLLKNTK